MVDSVEFPKKLVLVQKHMLIFTGKKMRKQVVKEIDFSCTNFRVFITFLF